MSQHGVKRDMPYVRLGKSGLKISRIVLGCMTYGTPEWQGWVLGEEDGLKHIKAAFDAGINAFDTANVYSDGRSEEILGKAIKKYNLPRDEIVVMTKVFYPVQQKFNAWNILDGTNADEYGLVNQYGLSRKHIFDSVKHSLRRLDLDYIDVLQCHRFDANTPVEETMQALHDVVKAGYVRYIGMSSCYAYQFAQMQNYAINNNLTPFISMQNHYNAIYREEEREMIPTLKHFGVGSIPWSALARGLVTRPWKVQTQRSSNDPWSALYSNDASQEEIVKRVEKIAEARGISMAQVGLAWILSKDVVSAPLIGTTSLDNLKDIIAGVHVKLTEEEIKSLEEPYKPQSISGHW